VIYAIKLLLPTLFVCAVAFLALRVPFKTLLSKTEYQRAWVLLIVANLIAYLSHTPMFYIIGVTLMALFAGAFLGGGIRGKLAAYMLLIVALPPLSWQLGGIGDINYVLSLTGPRMLAIVLLIGPALTLMGDKTYKREGWVLLLDVFILGYQLLKIVLMAPHVSNTGILRMSVESALDILLPYYVFTRAIRSEADLRFLVTHLVLGLALAGSVGMFEFLLRRNLYSELQYVYGFKWSLTMKVMRGDFLRVQANTPSPIVLAFEMISALGLWTYLRGQEWRRFPVLLVYFGFTCCLIFTISRGPWIGAAVFALALLGLRRLGAKTFVWLFMLLLASAVLAKAMGADEQIVAALGAVFGSSEQDLNTINYRRVLLDTALALLKQSPWLGVPDYASQMQDLKQGEGIIDLVNSYVAIALDTGVIGLVIYMFPFVLVFRRLVRVPGISLRKVTGDAGTGAGWFAATFVALMIACLLTIFTTSTFASIPILLLMLLVLPIARLTMDNKPVDVLLDLPAEGPIGLDGLPFARR
jgi:O-antigen ligase